MMKTINGKYHFQVKDLKEMLEQEPDDAVIVAMVTNGDGKHCERGLYKTATSADDEVVYLYLHND